MLTQLSDEYTQAGKERQFDSLKPLLTGGGSDYPSIAKELGWTDNATRVAAHRLRVRYRELLRSEIAQTVASADDVEEEIRWLFTVFGG